MKPIVQIIALLIVTENILQIAVAIGGIFLMVKLLSDQLKSVRSKSIIRKRKKALESNMWAID